MFDRVHLGALFYLGNHVADFIKSLTLSDQQSSNSSVANVGTAQEYFCFAV